MWLKLGAGELGLDDKPAMLEEEGVHSLVREVVHHMPVRVMEVGVHNLVPVEVAGLHSLALEAEVLHIPVVDHTLADQGTTISRFERANSKIPGNLRQRIRLMQ